MSQFEFFEFGENTVISTDRRFYFLAKIIIFDNFVRFRSQKSDYCL